MKKKVKLIANYLPQFHVIPENSRWWGDGYTDWVGVRQAEPQFQGQHQPRIPLHENYYSLDDPAVLKWQADLARKYGVYGFGMYHYWFSSELQLLQKPAEILLAHPAIDIHFMFIWDNTSWTRTWVRKGAANDWAPKFDEQPASPQESGMLAELRYGTEADWKSILIICCRSSAMNAISSSTGNPCSRFSSQTMISRCSRRWWRTGKNWLSRLAFQGSSACQKIMRIISALPTRCAIRLFRRTISGAG